MAKHKTTKTKKQVGFLLSKSSPLSQGQKSQHKKELKSGRITVVKKKRR